jgi:acyl dehydratase
VIRYDDLAAGSVIGSSVFSFTPAILAEWSALFPPGDAAAARLPPSMTSLVTMRAFMQVLPHRPPGNIHTAQKLRIERLPELGETLTTTVRCLAKEIRAERRWVTFQTDTVDAAAKPLFAGRLRLIWAA